MKISLIGPVYPYRGGISHSHTLLGSALQQAGHEIQVISFKRQYPAWLYPGKSDKDPNLQESGLPVSFLLDPLYPWTWSETIRTIRAFQPDLVIFQWWTVFWSPAWAWICWRLNRQGIKTVFFIHNVVPHEPRRLDPWLASLALRQSAAYITLTEKEHQRLRSLLGNFSKPVFSTPLPAYQLGKALVSKNEARTRLGLPLETPVLLFFGLVRPYKGLFYLIEACGQLTHEPFHPLLVIAGEFWEDPETYKAQIKRLNLDEWIRIENRYLPDEEAALWFCAADLFVAPYTGGTQSAALRVALGYGLPVIATDTITGEFTDLNSSILTIVPAGDALALAEAIRQRLIDLPKTTTLPSIDEQWQRMVEVIGQASQAINIH